jgi:Cu-Zn family superoxide dismutase
MRLTATVAVIAVSAAAAVFAAAPTKAVAVLHPTQGSSVEGKVTFSKADAGVKVSVHVTGLTAGKHGFHVHEFGDCSAADGASAGGHFNPSAESHGAPTDGQRHTGDLGNIEANDAGVADLEYTDSRVAFDGANSVLGRGVIIHAGADDLKTQPTGNAGGRLACGVIGVAKAE